MDCVAFTEAGIVKTIPGLSVMEVNRRSFVHCPVERVPPVGKVAHMIELSQSGSFDAGRFLRTI
jgi:hypothetical protein